MSALGGQKKTAGNSAFAIAWLDASASAANHFSAIVSGRHYAAGH